MRGAGAVLGLALALAGCAQPAALPKAPVAAGGGVTVATRPVELGAARIGDFEFAGGVVLTSADTSRLHGLSDLKLIGGEQLLAVSDEGDVFTARLRLDPAGSLVGVSDARIDGLAGPDGGPLQGKVEADAEGVAMLANGDRLVSFEGHHRILRYPAKGGRPVEAPMPQASLPANDGMEALAAAPASGRDAYLVGAEATGQTWICRQTCAAAFSVALPADFGLTAATPVPGGGWAVLIRAWDALRGNRIALIVLDAGGREVTRAELARPLVVDNFEGLAAQPGPGGAIRFYLISDDNFSNKQQTLLLAFDWRRPAP